MQLTPKARSGDSSEIALAICYELSVVEHAERAFENGAKIYVASVAKTRIGVEQAVERLAAIARSYAAPVLMANSVGESDGGTCGGKTSVWSRQGKLLAQLDEAGEGLIVYDVELGSAVALQL